MDTYNILACVASFTALSRSEAGSAKCHAKLKYLRQTKLQGDSSSWESPEKEDNVYPLFI